MCILAGYTGENIKENTFLVSIRTINICVKRIIINYKQCFALQILLKFHVSPYKNGLRRELRIGEIDKTDLWKWCFLFEKELSANKIILKIYFWFGSVVYDEELSTFNAMNYFTLLSVHLFHFWINASVLDVGGTYRSS